MNGTTTSTDIQPSWLELPEEQKYWAIKGYYLGRPSPPYARMYVAEGDAYLALSQHPQDESPFVVTACLDEVMADVARAGRLGVKVLRWRDGDWQTLATCEVAHYFGGDRG